MIVDLGLLIPPKRESSYEREFSDSLRWVPPFAGTSG
jgi:hypothetical protein